MKFDDHKDRLNQRFAELTLRLKGVEVELDSPHSADWEELATERESDEVLEGIGLTGLREMRQIEAALGRIVDGSYGICAGCGADIDAARLQLLPHTPFCSGCAK